jgi:hypothetical protein
MKLQKAENLKNLVGVSKIKDENSKPLSIGQRQGSADPDPYQNVMDPQTLLDQIL